MLQRLLCQTMYLDMHLTDLEKPTEGVQVCGQRKKKADTSESQMQQVLRRCHNYLFDRTTHQTSECTCKPQERDSYPRFHTVGCTQLKEIV